MPQLNLAWWLFNFFLGWLTLIILITIISNKSLISHNITSPLPSTQAIQNTNWYWN